MVARVLTLALKHWKPLLCAMGIAAFTITLQLQRYQHAKELVRAVAAGKEATRDSVARATQVLVDSAARARMYSETQLRVAKAQSDEQLRRANIRLSSNAATDSLYASLRRLSDSAKADTTVTAVVTSSVAVATENDSLRSDVRGLSTSLLTERAAANSLHAADTAAIRGLATAVVVVRDSLAVEAKRPKRTLKSNAAIAGIGAGSAFVLRSALKYFTRKKS